MTSLADLQAKIADAFVLLSAMPSEAGIDLASAIEAKFFSADAGRTWKSAT